MSARPLQPKTFVQHKAMDTIAMGKYGRILVDDKEVWYVDHGIEMKLYDTQEKGVK